MTAPPYRVRLSRRRGWRMPANTVSVARPTRWGNPFTIDAARAAGSLPVGIEGNTEALRAEVVTRFRLWICGGDAGWLSGDKEEIEARRRWMLAHLPDLRGRNLACWCPLDQPCHAEVLLELAARAEPL